MSGAFWQVAQCVANRNQRAAATAQFPDRNLKLSPVAPSDYHQTPSSLGHAKLGCRHNLKRGVITT
jgi:hypothetical protein